MSARICVLASGEGTNLEALLEASARGGLAGEVVAVVSDVEGSGALRRAARRGTPAVPVTAAPGEAREAYDARLGTEVARHSPDLVVLAGWMRILTPVFLDGVGAPVINLHPALPGEFPGTRAIERAWAERGGGRTRSGVMVHFVPDAGVDDGPVILAVGVPLDEGDTLAEFASRMHAAEHRAIVKAVNTVVGAPARAGGTEGGTTWT